MEMAIVVTIGILVGTALIGFFAPRSDKVIWFIVPYALVFVCVLYVLYGR